MRRIILSEVPTMAIDEVIVLKNDSPLYDEIVAHRLGMIPLTTDLENYNLPEDCECGGFGCTLCQNSLTCEITNETNNPMVIYSKDLKSSDPEIAPVNPDIPIVKIDKGDQIILEAYAVLGKARDHVKWQSVSNVSYKYYPEISFDDSKCKNCPDKCIVSRMCPEKLYEYEGEGDPNLVKDYWKECTLCDACQNECPQEAIKVDWKPNMFIFSIESDGALPFDMLLKKTFEILKGKIEEFIVKLEEAEIEA